MGKKKKNKKGKKHIKDKLNTPAYPVLLSDKLKDALEVVNTHDWAAAPNEQVTHTSYSDQIMAAALLVAGGNIPKAVKATGIGAPSFRYRLMQSAFVREVADTAKLALIDTAEGHLMAMVEDGKLSAKNRKYALNLNATEWKDMIKFVLRSKGGYVMPNEAAMMGPQGGAVNIQVVVQNMPEHPHPIVSKESDIADPQAHGNYIHYELPENGTNSNGNETK